MDAFRAGSRASTFAQVLGNLFVCHPGRYFRLMLLGYFEGLGSERGMAWRAADSLAIRSFLGLELDEAAPDHSTISRTRRLIDVETHERVFTPARAIAGIGVLSLVGVGKGCPDLLATFRGVSVLREVKNADMTIPEAVQRPEPSRCRSRCSCCS